MGAWGTGIFEDDMALDAINEIEDSEEQREFFISAFKTVLNKDQYIQYDDGYRVIISAVFIDGIVNGTRFDGAGTEIDSVIENYKEIQVNDLCTLAKQALGRVISEGSELNELWMENTEDYLKWKIGIEALINRLS